MPALSQNLTFTIDDTSTVVLDYPNDGLGPLEYASDPIKGDGYFGGSDGLHTVQTNISDFVGKIELQGTLAASPTTDDWFTINLGSTTLTMDVTGLISETSVSYIEHTQATSEIKTYNFIGNFTWVRAKVSNWTEGRVNNIRINH